MTKMIERIAEVEGGLQEETTYDGRKLRWSEEARKGLWTMKNAYQRHEDSYDSRFETAFAKGYEQGFKDGQKK